jgi:hypothetical protein
MRLGVNMVTERELWMGIKSGECGAVGAETLTVMSVDGVACAIGYRRWTVGDTTCPVCMIASICIDFVESVT